MKESMIKGLRMKKISLRVIAAMFCGLALSACSNFLLEKPRDASGEESPGTEIPPGFGAVRVVFSQGTARTIIPQPDMDNLYPEYWFTKDGGTAEKKTPGGGIFVLEPGSYSLEVKVFADSARQDLAAEGTTDADFTIATGDAAGEVNLTLYPIVSGDGTGSLAFNLQYPVGVTVESFTLSRIAGDDSIDLTEGISPSGGDPVSFSGTKDEIPVGYYLLRVVLRNSAGAAIGKTEVVHIYRNLTSETTGYSFTNDDFTAYLVTNANDTGPGSLRQALSSVPEGQTIRVMLEPGSVIELESNLEISKNLILEGNGVTLTRAASWTGIDFMLNIYDREVTIRGVHFKGDFSMRGAAIDNDGNLTLESCIFSGHRNSGSGGAIYSFSSLGNLTIRACTFYGNTGNDYGGAVYFGGNGSLTLTGNLFYGNSARGSPVVCNYYGYPINASYNVVDVDINSSGWTAGTGDTGSISVLPVSPKSFKLLAGSGAAGRLPDPLPAGYPATDFYGQPISGGGAAGAVQSPAANGSGYYPELSVNNSLAGTVSISPTPVPDEDGFYPSGSSITITASPNPEYSFTSWLVDGDKTPGTDTNPDSLTLSPGGHTRIQAVFSRQITVNTLTDGVGDSTNVTLRYALTNAQDGDVISLSGVTPGVTVIELESSLPSIIKNLTIEGKRVTLTRAASWGGYDSQLLFISTYAAEVTISGVHFKNGRANQNGGALRSYGKLTLESCIFSGNQVTGISYSNGGAVYIDNDLTIRGCTFYGNTSRQGGAVYVQPYHGNTLTLTGNLFYGNSGERVVSGYDAITSSYNVVDKDFGWQSDRCGWAQGTGDMYTTSLAVSGKSFKLLAGSDAAGRLPVELPEGYPTTDFYGQPINGGGAAGAVQGSTANQNGYVYLDVSVNNSLAGNVAASSIPDADGLVPINTTITANPNWGYSFVYWLVDNYNTGNTNPLTISAHTWIQAVFNRQVTVNNWGDGPESAATEGTLRYALTNAQEGDVITFAEVTAGTTLIELESVLPQITKSITIEGNGVTLTRDESWTTVDYFSQLLYINNSNAVVSIRRVHFKNSLSNGGGTIENNGGTLTLESCVFNGNSGTHGGAINSDNTLTIRGCTFYGNTASYGGVVYFAASGKTLTLIGNLFYENSAGDEYPMVFLPGGNGTVSASYNVVDVAYGTGSTRCGWAQGTGDTTFTALGINGAPFDTTTFVPVGSLQSPGVLPSTRPADFPETDFYGNNRTFPGAPGAVDH
jgi:predicted outer membrane repeat protein